MAGDWLKIEAVTPDKPEVFEIATLCKISPDEAFGKLFRVWRWFDQQTENGNARNVTWAYLDHVVGVSGFAEAMHSVGWITGGEAGKMGVNLPNFDRHNGKTAKARALTAKRVASHKQRTTNATLTVSALPREEKRREEEHLDRFGRFWSAYPRKVAKPRALKAWKRLTLTFEKFEALMAALEREKVSEQWGREDGRFIPHPATWLNDGRFEDEVTDEKPAASPQAEPCPCGAPGTVKVGGKWRCSAHVRGLEAAA